MIRNGIEKGEARHKLYFGKVLHDMLRVRSNKIDNRWGLGQPSGVIDAMENGAKK